MTGGYLRRLVDRAAGVAEPGALQPRIPALFEPITTGFQPVGDWSGAPSAGDGAVDWGPDRPERPTAVAAAPDQSRDELGYPAESAAPSEEASGSTRPVRQPRPVDAEPQPFTPRASAAPSLGPDRPAAVPAASAPPPAPPHSPTSNLGGPRAAEAGRGIPQRPVAADGEAIPAPVVLPPSVPDTRPPGTAGQPVTPARTPAEPPIIAAAAVGDAAPAVDAALSGRTSEAVITHSAWPASPPRPATDGRASGREEPTVVRVSIGRIEVHATAPDTSAALPPAPMPEPPISLERYLQGRVPR